MHVALDRGHNNLSSTLLSAVGFGFDKRNQVCNGFLHDSGGLNHLGQKHFAGAEQVADLIHPAHQRAFNHIQRTLGLDAGLFDVFQYMGINALN